VISANKGIILKCRILWFLGERPTGSFKKMPDMQKSRERAYWLFNAIFDRWEYMAVFVGSSIIKASVLIPKSRVNAQAFAIYGVSGVLPFNSATKGAGKSIHYLTC